MTNFYISVYSETVNVMEDTEIEKVNNDLYNMFDKMFASLNLYLEYDHGFGDWYNWFQISFIDSCDPNVLFPHLEKLSADFDFLFSIVVDDSKNPVRWDFMDGKISEPEFSSDYESFPEIESAQHDENF